jgi:hypothetical protein
VEENIFVVKTHQATRSVVNLLTAVTHNRRIGFMPPEDKCLEAKRVCFMYILGKNVFCTFFVLIGIGI